MALLDEGTDRYLRIDSDGSGVLSAVLDGLAPHHTRRKTQFSSSRAARWPIFIQLCAERSEWWH